MEKNELDLCRSIWKDLKNCVLMVRNMASENSTEMPFIPPISLEENQLSRKFKV